MSEGKKDLNKIMANSYCVLYEEGEFVIALGDKVNDDVKIKGIMRFDDENFKRYFETVCEAVIQFEKDTGRNFLEELTSEVNEEV